MGFDGDELLLPLENLLASARDASLPAESRGFAVRQIGRHVNDQAAAIDALNKLILDSHLRDDAVLALMSLGGPQAKKAFLDYLDANPSLVDISMLQSLSDTGWASLWGGVELQRAVKMLLARAAESSGRLDILMCVTESLGDLRNLLQLPQAELDEVARVLSEIATANNADAAFGVNRYSAINALGKLRLASSVPALEKCMGMGDIELALASLKAIRNTRSKAGRDLLWKSGLYKRMYLPWLIFMGANLAVFVVAVLCMSLGFGMGIAYSLLAAIVAIGPSAILPSLAYFGEFDSGFLRNCWFIYSLWTIPSLSAVFAFLTWRHESWGLGGTIAAVWIPIVGIGQAVLLYLLAHERNGSKKG